MSPSEKSPWYAAGLRFECQPDCGICCTNHGDYSHVYLENSDIAAMAEELGLTRREFRRRYVKREDGWQILEMGEKDCPFLDGSRCNVYAARPIQCRTFPFWRENLDSPKSWEGLSEFCPGIGQGPRHPLHVINDRLEERE